MLAYKLANTPGQDHRAHTMNRVALDFKDDCLSNSITNSTLLHTILYTACTDLDMKRRLSDWHHAAEAMRLINRDLASGGPLIDGLIAAVAIVVTREASPLAQFSTRAL